MEEGRSIESSFHVLGEKLALRSSNTCRFSSSTVDALWAARWHARRFSRFGGRSRRGSPGVTRLRSLEPTPPTAAFTIVTACVGPGLSPRPPAVGAWGPLAALPL